MPNPPERKLGLLPSCSLVVASMIGVGIFTTSGLLMDDIGNAAIMIALWLVGGVIALCGALCYGELGATYPESGGEYAFLSKMFGPLAGFLSGWISFIVGFSAPIAAASIGFSAYIHRAAPGLFQDSVANAETLRTGLSVAVIATFSLIHLGRIEFSASVQVVLTALKVLLVVGLLATGFAYGSGDFEHLSAASRSVRLDYDTVTVAAVSMLWIMFSFSGWNASVYIGSEVSRPGRNIPLSLILGTGLVTVLYVLLNILFVYANGPEAMKGVLAVGGLTVANLFNDPGIERLFSAMVAIALLSSISAMVLLGPRVYAAMARDGAFFRFAAQNHPTRNVPAISILFQGVTSIGIVLTGTFDQILTYVGFALGVFPVACVAGLVVLRLKGQSARRLPGYPATAILFLFGSVGILALAFTRRPLEGCVALATIAAGIPAYHLFKRMPRLDVRRRGLP